MKLSALTAIALTFTLPLAAATLEEEKYIDGLLPSLTENVTTEKNTTQASTKTESKSSKALTHVGGITVPDQPYAQEMIQKYILSYTSTEYAKKALVETLDKGELYRLYIRQELKKRNMPPALEYLPVVESEY